MASFWFAALSAIVAQRTAVTGGVEPEERGVVLAIHGGLLAVAAVLLRAGF